MQTEPKFSFKSWLRSPTGLTVVAFLAIAAFYLVMEHTAHVFSFLPYALLLLCPLMHLFMHGGHGHGGHGHTAGSQEHGGHSEHSSYSDQAEPPKQRLERGN
ncbi:MAG: hypothetical protein DPW09_01350 [Anaerolineae bacterium]|nr:hypothetical protein [Anaerolineae bacterium]